MHISEVTDPRPMWAKFRRRELYAICANEGIKISPGAPATTMVTLLNDAGVDPFRYSPQSVAMLRAGEDRIKVSKELIQTEDVPQEEVETIKAEIEEVNIDEMKMHELRTWCKQHGIKPMPRDTKKALLVKAKARMNGTDVT